MTTCGISPTYSKTLRLIALPPYDPSNLVTGCVDCNLGKGRKNGNPPQLLRNMEDTWST